MKYQQRRKVIHSMGAAIAMILSGCATAFVRSDNTVEPKHVFPATAFDGRFFWEAGVKGKPLFAPADPDQKNGPVVRFAFCAGAIVDLPFSIAFDTVLLPFDLIRPGPPAEKLDGEPAGAAKESQPVRADLQGWNSR